MAALLILTRPASFIIYVRPASAVASSRRGDGSPLYLSAMTCDIGSPTKLSLSYYAGFFVFTVLAFVWLS